MNVTSVKTRDYEDKRLCRLRQNKPNSNPIKPNFKGKKEKGFAPKADNLHASLVDRTRDVNKI